MRRWNPHLWFQSDVCTAVGCRPALGKLMIPWPISITGGTFFALVYELLGSPSTGFVALRLALVHHAVALHTHPLAQRAQSGPR
jgi:hypothetical protein